MLTAGLGNFFLNLLPNLNFCEGIFYIVGLSIVFRHLLCRFAGLLFPVNSFLISSLVQIVPQVKLLVFEVVLSLLPSRLSLSPLLIGVSSSLRWPPPIIPTTLMVLFHLLILLFPSSSTPSHAPSSSKVSLISIGFPPLLMLRPSWIFDHLRKRSHIATKGRPLLRHPTEGAVVARVRLDVVTTEFRVSTS